MMLRRLGKLCPRSHMRYCTSQTTCAVAYAKTSLEQYMELSTPTESSELVFATPATLL